MPLYRIAWKTETGFEGHGEYISNVDADIWIEYLNRQHTNIHHWIESIESIKTIQVAHCTPDSAARGPSRHT